MTVLVKSTSRQTSRLSSDGKQPIVDDKGATEGLMTISAFLTPLGWMGLLGQNDQMVSVFAGHSSLKSVKAAASKFTEQFADGDWNPSARNLLEAYAEGEIVDFSAIEIRHPEMTEFRRKVVSITTRIGYGQTVTYGELARRAGHPRAARAVGTVMSTNRFPILIPCHRVLASGGKLGGYTSPAGTNLKQRMLDLEARMTGK